MMLAVEWQDVVGLGLAVLAVIYLVVVLVVPEKF
jgi:hypothetical protein